MLNKKSLGLALLILCPLSFAQTGTTAPATPAKKPATAAKPKTATTGAAKSTTTKPTPPAADPEAIFETSMGKMKCTLFPKQAPKTVANFIGLAEGTKEWTDPKTGKVMKGVPLYDKTVFHRVIPNFMIQGGDPIGNGTGGPGYKFEDEFNSPRVFDKPGILAMANAG